MYSMRMRMLKNFTLQHLFIAIIIIYYYYYYAVDDAR